jgi:hypothetical protein
MTRRLDRCQRADVVVEESAPGLRAGFRGLGGMKRDTLRLTPKPHVSGRQPLDRVPAAAGEAQRRAGATMRAAMTAPVTGCAALNCGAGGGGAGRQRNPTC